MGMLLQIGKLSHEDLRPLEALFDKIDVDKERRVERRVWAASHGLWRKCAEHGPSPDSGQEDDRCVCVCVKPCP